MPSLAPGFLVAAPPLGDPNFEQSVVLLAAHGAEGAFGWVINGRDVMTMSELLKRLELAEQGLGSELPIRLGGPVGQEQVWLLYRTGEKLADLEDQFEVCPGVTASPSAKVLQAVVEGRAPKSLLGVVGYAGWAPEQLEHEIRVGAWLPTDADSHLIFEIPRERMWRASYERIGTTPMAFTTRTVGEA